MPKTNFRGGNKTKKMAKSKVKGSTLDNNRKLEKPEGNQDIYRIEAYCGSGKCKVVSVKNITDVVVGNV